MCWVRVMLGRVRRRVEELMDPLGRIFSRTGLPPNAFTLMGLFLGVVSAALFALGEAAWGGLVLLLCGFFDMIDGAVARAMMRETGFGGVLDSVVDRYVDMMVLGGIVCGGLAEIGFLPGWVWGFLAIAGCFMVSYTRARAEAAGSGKLDVGIAERAERMLILAFGAIVGYTKYAVLVVAVLAHLTVFHRLIVAERRLR